jgi:disulfide bond formation protein DsbB
MRGPEEARDASLSDRLRDFAKCVLSAKATHQMKFELSPRLIFAGFALVPLALLGEGLMLQHFQGQAPCPLCVLQREAFFLYGVIALAAAIHNPQRRGAAIYAGGLALAALAGMSVAIWHVWSLYHPKFGCGIDVMEQFVNNLPTAKLLPFMFYASGDCAARNDPILGLVVPEWALVWFAVLFLAAVFFAFKFLTTAPARAIS